MKVEALLSCNVIKANTLKLKELAKNNVNEGGPAPTCDLFRPRVCFFFESRLPNHDCGAALTFISGPTFRHIIPRLCPNSAPRPSSSRRRLASRFTTPSRREFKPNAKLQPLNTKL
ncbi:putative UDP-glucuronosyltransferase [Corchorus olitorius]|uniref:UDP-glucuronosyltransferase n=1 Tax=Corchorus olitorius TaxID=93759 RepID=A0A1R3J4L8_9ROSI|nr:putative UDP-glucuronosyltransferase [Corchorus olitorius]